MEAVSAAVSAAVAALTASAEQKITTKVGAVFVAREKEVVSAAREKGAIVEEVVVEDMVLVMVVMGE